MSTTVKAKSTTVADTAQAAPAAPRSRVTPIEDVPKYEAMIDRKFRLKNGESPQDIFTPVHIFEEFLHGADEMESSATCVRFCVQRTSNNGNGEPAPAPQLILGREIRAKAPAKEFFRDCALFAEQFEEVRL
jgi:hypothetical protein